MPLTAVEITYKTIQMASAEDPPTPSIREEYDPFTSPIWSAALDPCTDAMDIVFLMKPFVKFYQGRIVFRMISIIGRRFFPNFLIWILRHLAWWLLIVAQIRFILKTWLRRVIWLLFPVQSQLTYPPPLEWLNMCLLGLIVRSKRLNTKQGKSLLEVA